MITDPVADMLTMIRNAKSIYRVDVTFPHSKLKEEIIKKLKAEGFVKDYEVIKVSPQNKIKVLLKYGPDGEQLIQTIEKVSKPGRRVYKATRELKKVLAVLGTMIVSTPKGIMTDRECREKKTGGEVLCFVC